MWKFKGHQSTKTNEHVHLSTTSPATMRKPENRMLTEEGGCNFYNIIMCDPNNFPMRRVARRRRSSSYYLCRSSFYRQYSVGRSIAKGSVEECLTENKSWAAGGNLFAWLDSGFCDKTRFMRNRTARCRDRTSGRLFCLHILCADMAQWDFIDMWVCEEEIEDPSVKIHSFIHPSSWRVLFDEVCRSTKCVCILLSK